MAGAFIQANIWMHLLYAALLVSGCVTKLGFSQV